MDEPVSSAAEQVVKIITDAVEAIAKHRNASTKGSERDRDLFFPEGIGDIHVSFKAPGGVDIDVTIASSRPKGEPVARFLPPPPPPPPGTEHPMFVHNGGPTPVYLGISGTPGGPYREVPVDANKSQIIS